MEYAQLADNVVVYLADNQELMASTKIKFNAIITDPPYGVNYKQCMGGRGGGNSTY